MSELPAPTARADSGRWLGGVCAGLAARWAVPVARVRLAFVLAGALFGLGVLVYLAAWLILPGEAEHGGQRGIVLVAQAVGALFGLGVLASGGAAATIFGFGWVVVALAAAVLLGVLLGWNRLGPAWALLPIGALVLPSVALAAGGVRIEPSTERVTVAPRTVAELDGEFRSGLGLLTIDLRHTALPARGEIPLRIGAGVRRTLIALPHDRCVNVSVATHEPSLLARAVGAIWRETNFGAPYAVLFGGFAELPPARGPGPTLLVDFSSLGGSLVVRDYPDAVDPQSEPDWPGYPVYLEARPDTAGLSRKQARRTLREWRERRAEQRRSKARIERLMGGPCAAKR